ncbi:MAG: hypothetical protein ACMG6E_03770 [Candidatus Roizmanbacteria bacterium]
MAVELGGPPGVSLDVEKHEEGGLNLLVDYLLVPLLQPQEGVQ